MRPVWIAAILIVAVGCSAPDPKLKLVGTWQHTEAKSAIPITYNADGTFVQTMTWPDRPNATAISKGTYTFDGEVMTSKISDVQVYGLIPVEAGARQAQLSQMIGKEIKTNVTFVSPDELLAEAGGHKLTFKRVAGTK